MVGLQKFDSTGTWFNNLKILKLPYVYKTTVFAFALRNRVKLGIWIWDVKSARVGGLLVIEPKQWLKTRSRQQIGYMLSSIVSKVSVATLHKVSPEITIIRMKRL